MSSWLYENYKINSAFYVHSLRNYNCDIIDLHIWALYKSDTQIKSLLNLIYHQQQKQQWQHQFCEQITMTWDQSEVIKEMKKKI
jgi:hypothetical protein